MGSEWTGNDDAPTQHLAEASQEAGIVVIRYESVQAPGLACLVAFGPDALNEPRGRLDATRQK